MSILTYFFLVLIPLASSITFNFTNITNNSQDFIIFSGDAACSPDNGIMLTHGRNSDQDGSAGRASYNKLLHLWDGVSNDLASFTTSFTFIIDSYDPRNNHTDGLTFFLSENNSVITPGGYMGLPIDSPTVSTSHRFVAVEFDTFGGNDWDPKDPKTNISIDDHVGIDVDSITSIVSRKWSSYNITYGKECRALINYDSDSKNLSVSFTNFKNNSLVWDTGLVYTIDLRPLLTEWVIFGFSASTRNLYENIRVISWTFNSTEFKVDETNEKNSSLRKMGCIVGLLVILTVLSILACLLWRMKNNDGNKGEEVGLLEMNINEFEIGATRRFTYHHLALSTDDFAETKKLGEGGFGGVYQGFLKEFSMYVAIKRVSKTSKQGVKEYSSEVRIISRLGHKNLVQLIGWCHEKGELLLVYEFMENGSLDLHLFEGKSLLPWNIRFKIAYGLASALLYLHEEWEQCVLHRDIKSSNVMLDSNFNAKLGDFGLAKLVDHEKASQITMLAGTIGYMAPEYIDNGRPTKESDVFSFGVVALEIACGRRAIDHKAQEKQVLLLEWVWEHYGNGTLLEVVDMSLGSKFEVEEIKRLMTVGLWCVHSDSKLRPSMRQVIQVLNSEASLPFLPSKMPVTSYLTPPVSSLSDFPSNELWQVVGIRADVIKEPTM